MKSSIFIFLVILLTLTPLAAEAQVHDSLVGTWNLVSYEDTPDKGHAEFPWGKQPSGILIYDDTGHMAVQLQRTPVDASIAKKDPSKLTNADKLKLLGAYSAYFGTYSVDWVRMTIVHHVTGNLFTIYIGTDQEKGFQLDGDRFTLKTSWDADGKHWSGIRIFERIKAVTGN